MRKAVAFFLLFSICYYNIGSLVLVEVRLASLIQQVHHKFETDNLMTLSLTKNEYNQYLKGDDELCIKGEWFDIKKIVNSGTEILVYCIPDKTETKIFAELKNFFSHNIPQEKSSVPNTLIKFLGLFFIPSFYDNSFQRDEGLAFEFFNYSLKSPAAFFPVSTPPPKG